MKATTLDLRYRTKDVLKTLLKNSEGGPLPLVTALYAAVNAWYRF
jgi:hypothetical protein